MRRIEKPILGEYPPYSRIYLDLLDDEGDILEQLWNNYLIIKKYIYTLPKEKLVFRYNKGKWTIKEILLHIIDDERIFVYRALRYARNDNTPVHGFNQDKYALYSDANSRSLESIFEEYESVRKATITLFKYLPEDSLIRRGSGIDHDGTVVNQRSVRGLVYHIAGHELRHFNIIKERYIEGTPMR